MIDAVAVQFKALRDETARRVDSLEGAVAAERVKIAGLLAVVDGTPGFREPKPYPSLAARIDSKGNGNWRDPDTAQRTIDALKLQDEALRADNEAAAKHNAAMVNAAMEFCRRIGLPERENYLARGDRTAKWHMARWLEGMHGIGPRCQSWVSVEQSYSARKSSIDRWREELAEEQRKKEYADRAERHRLDNERQRIAEEIRREQAATAGPAPTRNEAMQERLRTQIREAPAPAVPAFETPGKALEID